MPPPWWVYYSEPPNGSATTVIDGTTYYVLDDVYYETTNYQGQETYQVVPPPEGTVVTELPAGAAMLTAGDDIYFFYASTFYREFAHGSEIAYVVVNEPPAVFVLDALPSGFDIVEMHGASYFLYQGGYYLPYLDLDGHELFVGVDGPAPPRQEPPPPRQEQPPPRQSARGYAERLLTVPFDTEIAIRIAGELTATSNRAGDPFTGFLDADLIVDGLLAAPHGSRVYGRLVDVGEATMALELTDIETGGLVIELETARLELDGDVVEELRQSGGGADLGEYVGGPATATPDGDALAIRRQTLLTFRLDRAFKVKTRVYV